MNKLLLSLLLMFICRIVLAQDDLDLSKMIGRVDSSNIFISKDYYTWGASVIKGDDGKYHMFYARWPHGERKDASDTLNYIFNGFRGWNKYSEIAYAVSDNITGPFHYVATALKGTGDKSRWDRFTFHNPLIRKFDGSYYLYFISNAFDSSYTLNRATTKENLQWLKYNCTQKIGVVKAKSIADLANGNYIESPSWLMAPDNKQTFEVATNPTVARGPDGKFYMMYKSRKPNVGNMTFWMAIADKPDGPYKTVGAVMTSEEMACEDPTIWYDKKRKRFYAAAKYFSNAKKLAPQIGALVLITSENGLEWKPASHSLVSLRELQFKNGTKQELANFERPFIVVDEKGNPIALLAAAAVKKPTEGNVQNVATENNSFNIQIPLIKK